MTLPKTQEALSQVKKIAVKAARRHSMRRISDRRISNGEGDARLSSSSLGVRSSSPVRT
ncbi:hypothetical protein [Bosea sp. (in: a-proteobacteria)]|uniref:hypothetical protein n=1 Tax=Bosea sp. (in: a-proteobacteria) TaxID=1871050 RepID=UPI00344AC5BF